MQNESTREEEAPSFELDASPGVVLIGPNAALGQRDAEVVLFSVLDLDEHGDLPVR